MKTVRFVRFVVPLVSVLIWCQLVSCSNSYRPSSSDRGWSGPPRAIPADELDDYGPDFTPGSYLQTINPSSPFFMSYPRIEDQPYKLLPDSTEVKVVSLKGSYAKVEVVRSGEVGYVPSIMLGEKRSSNQVPLTPNSNSNSNTNLNPNLTPSNNNEQLTPDISPELVDPSRPAE
ncbi:hypothetical protein N8314_00600 [Akkermansiaceae bacterium]|nr:hypothetical protein [Akkermansiaceae bacterium]